MSKRSEDNDRSVGAIMSKRSEDNDRSVGAIMSKRSEDHDRSVGAIVQSIALGSTIEGEKVMECTGGMVKKISFFLTLIS
jgi:hypothetical protein